MWLKRQKLYLKTVPLKNVNSILIITLSNIGDVILTTPVIDALIKNFPGAKIDLICGPRAIDLFKNDPAFRQVTLFDKFSSLSDKIKFIFKLRKQKYDMVIDLKNSLIPYFLNAPYRTSALSSKHRSLHMKDSHLKKIDRFKLNTTVAQFHIYTGREDQTVIDNKLKEANIDSKDRIIAVSPGARSKIKRWGSDRFLNIVNKLIEEFKYKVVLIGDKGDLELSKEIMSALVENGRDRSLLNLIGQTTLPQLAYLLNKCSLLITNDSACLHIASAKDLKTLAIFGPTDPKKYGPLARGSLIIQKELPCIPCEVAQCRFDLECMKKITPEEVLNKIREML